METSTKIKRRKTLLVNPLQFRIMVYMVAVSAMSSLITSLAGYLLSSYADALTYGGSMTMIFVTAFAFVAAWTLLILVFSNRIFGPIYRLHRELRNWRDGQPVHPIKLRKGDHLAELIDDFNQVAEKSAPQGSVAKS